MNGVWLRFRAELRTRWRAWLGFALLVGFAAGAVLALIAGGRRTDSAYDRFLAEHRASDVAIVDAGVGDEVRARRRCHPGDGAGRDRVAHRCPHRNRSRAVPVEPSRVRPRDRERARVAWLPILVLVPAAILLANVIAALPARAAARTQPVPVLRSE